MHLIARTIFATSVILLWSVAVPAQSSTTKQLDPIEVQVNEGTFLFRSLSITWEKYLGVKFQGEIVNNTSKDWDTAVFEVFGLDEAGNRIKNPFDLLNQITVYDFKKGAVKQIDGSYGKRLAGFESTSPTVISIKFGSGTYPAKYTFSMIKPNPSTELSFQDTFIAIDFVITKRQIAFSLSNKTDGPIKIDWNQVSYIDITGDSHKVMHEGVKYIDRSNAQAPSIVPPTAKLRDIVFPIDYVYYSEGRYGGWREEPLFPDGAAASKYAGKTFSVFMPLDISGTVKNYLFTFKVDTVEL